MLQQKKFLEIAQLMKLKINLRELVGQFTV